MTALSPSDPCSFSLPEDCQIDHLDISWDVDFIKNIIAGTAVLTVKKSKSVDSLVLDTRDLKIKKITDQDTGQDLGFKLHEPIPHFGSKLEIKLPDSSALRCLISIQYETSPQCSALQWLRSEQTKGKRQPYLFSQCQAIHARSLVPCQDTSGIKFPYTAQVTAPKEVVILMSALCLGAEPCAQDSSKLVHKFEQKIPIPSYLLAIAGGDIESRKIGPRSKVWSEKEMVDQAAYEFGETEKMLELAEAMMGKYVWGQYDLLVLPPSFPFGGMENPCLTFVTPTLLAGDRSLADVVAHEIMHSWTGNLVTNNNPEHFWLNEGHTVFMERKITAQLHTGEPYRHFLALGGWKDLQYQIVDVFGSDHPYTKLIPDLKGIDPDDAFSTVPYEKGFAFLFYLETLVGGPEVFEPFLKAYIEKFKFQSIDSYQWKDFLLSHFHEKVEQGVFKEVDWVAWFDGVGMPPVKPKYDESLVEGCKSLAERWTKVSDGDFGGFAPTDFQSMSSPQICEFLAMLLQESPLSVPKVQAMEKVYQLNALRNSEIKLKWLRLCLRAQWEEAAPLAIDFLNEQGRMKFVRPIYRDLYSWEKTRDLAISNFQDHRAEMHNTTAGLVAKDLELVQ